MKSARLDVEVSPQSVGERPGPGNSVDGAPVTSRSPTPPPTKTRADISKSTHSDAEVRSSSTTNAAKHSGKGLDTGSELSPEKSDASAEMWVDVQRTVNR